MLKFKAHKHIRMPLASSPFAALEGTEKSEPQARNVRDFCREPANRPGIPLDCTTYTSALFQSCTNIKSLNQLHARLISDKIHKPNVELWNAIIRGYARVGFCKEALTLYHQMQRTGVQPDKFTYPSVLKACARLSALEEGKEIHHHIIRSRFEADVFVGTALIDMYAKCGSLEVARQVFDEMSERNVVSWNALVAGYVQNGRVDEALKLFEKMPERDVISWNTLIAGYGQIGRIDVALKFFQKMPERNVVSWNGIIAACAQIGHVDEALKVFHKLSVRDVVSWTAMIAGYAENEYIDEALNLFRQMLLTGVKPDAVTFTSILPACARFSALENGREVHKIIIRSGFQSHIAVVSTLIDMYAKCGRTQGAHHVFEEMPERNVVSWNALIAGYGQNGHADDALKLFQKMPERDVVSWNAMIAGHAQGGNLNASVKLFHMMPKRNAVSWTAIIAGHVQNRCFNEALKLFQQMQLTGVTPDPVTFTSILPACANLAALKNGKEVHENIIKNGYQSYVSVGSGLVDMYAKCGTIDDACKVFDSMPQRDMASWNAMIVGYAKHGCGKVALQLFEQMQYSGTKPDRITFIGVLTACSHAGLVNDGWHYFSCMHPNYHITPAVEHYCCMVDLLGRAGQVNEAYAFINKMPIKPNADVWKSLLGACRIHSSMELGERVAEHLFELDPKNAGCFVLLSISMLELTGGIMLKRHEK